MPTTLAFVPEPSDFEADFFDLPVLTFAPPPAPQEAAPTAEPDAD